MHKLKTGEFCMIQWEAKRLPTPQEAVAFAVDQFTSGYRRKPKLVLVNEAIVCEYPKVEVRKPNPDEPKLSSIIVYLVR